MPTCWQTVDATSSDRSAPLAIAGNATSAGAQALLQEAAAITPQQRHVTRVTGSPSLATTLAMTRPAMPGLARPTG